MIVCERCGDEAPTSARAAAPSAAVAADAAHNHCMRQQPYSYTEEERGLMSSSTPPNVVFHDHGSSSRASPRINVLENSYPRAIVWGPLGPLTCCCPCVGHMGIGDSTGRIHDFAGPYYIGIDDFMVGCVLRYAVIPSDKDDQAWDESIARADEEYRKRMHNICCDNWCARAFMHFFFRSLI